MLLLVRCQTFQRFSLILLFLLLSFISSADGCRSDQFACRDGTECIRHSYRCDGTSECDDGSDEIDCEQPILDNYLLVSVARLNTEAQHIRPQIYQIDLATGHFRTLLKTEPGTPASLAIDHKKQVLYYVDRSVEMIGCVSLVQGNSSMRVIYRDPTLKADIDGLAVDTEKQKLYFCDGGLDPMIVEIDLLDQDRTQRIITSGKSLKPKGLVIDEANSDLYWSDWGSKPGIFAIGLEPGAQMRTLIADNVVMPNALAIDFKEEIMYWVDAQIDRIEMANLDGQNRRVLVKEFGDVHYYAMTISPQFLYITDWTRSTILRVDRLTNSTSSQLPSLAGTKTGIAYYNSNFTNVGRAVMNRSTVAGIQPSTAAGIQPSTAAGIQPSTVAGITRSTAAGIQRSTVVLHPTTSDEKAEAERLVNEKGSETAIALAVTGSLFLLILIIALAIWFGVRRRRRCSADVTMAVGYSPSVAFEEGRSGRGRLLIEEDYQVKANSYEYLPEVGAPPAVPANHPQPTACGPDGEWYTKLTDVSSDPVKTTGYYVKPTEYDYYDDTKYCRTDGLDVAMTSAW